uniref:Transmembrane protein n=1 Tax=Amphora coffeiformis TaxID=265554 RepID=A0A7S3LAE7_9STRA|mmetsp:Transcript_17944/g.33904  ORF Transcript_17944/g.33904 Transcript_17944/m.33904 type:complete len:228 (-) Transcript_17944:19-702(-)
MSFRRSPAVLLGMIFMALHMTTAASESPRLRAGVVAAQVVEAPRVDDTDFRQQQRRKVEESLEVLYVDEDKEETRVHESEHLNEDKEETTVHERESMSQDANTVAKQSKPTATLAERETEDPLLMQEDSPSLMFLNLSLSLTAQRFLAFMAAVVGMILTAHQMSENPDGLYASLCRSILTVIRTVCRIATCKPCCAGDGRGASAHRHIPISTMEYAYKVTDPSVEFQ